MKRLLVGGLIIIHNPDHQAWGSDRLRLNDNTLTHFDLENNN